MNICPALWIDTRDKHECDLPVGHRGRHHCQCGAGLRRRDADEISS